MDFSLAASFVHFLFGVLVLFLIWHLGVRPYLLDRFRSKLFNLRDELFDYAADGNIEFDDARYGTLRMWLNALIRMAHRVTFLDTIVVTQLAQIDPKSDSTVERRLARIERILNGEEGEELQDFAIRSLKISTTYFFLRSPLMWFVVAALVVLLLFQIVARGLHSAVRSTSDAIIDRFGRRIEDQVRLSGGVGN
jgi:hypothetical protein